MRMPRGREDAWKDEIVFFRVLLVFHKRKRKDKQANETKMMDAPVVMVDYEDRFGDQMGSPLEEHGGNHYNAGGTARNQDQPLGDRGNVRHYEQPHGNDVGKDYVGGNEFIANDYDDGERQVGRYDDEDPRERFGCNCSNGVSPVLWMLILPFFGVGLYVSVRRALTFYRTRDRGASGSMKYSLVRRFSDSETLKEREPLCSEDGEAMPTVTKEV